MSDETTELSRSSRAARSARPEPPERARVCPSCGVFNVLSRHVCRACGADLTTGEPLPWPEPDLRPGTAVPALHDRPHPRRWWFAIAAVLAVIAIVVLGLIRAELGPFSDPVSAPTIDFPEDAYDTEPEELLLSDIATISVHPPEDGRDFAPSNLVDGAPETAWLSDGLQDPLLDDDPLEIIDLMLSEPAWVDHLTIRNGDQIDLDAYERNGRVQVLRATFDGGSRYLLHLLDEGRGLQAVELPQPKLTTMVRLEVLELFPGTDSDGVAIADLQLHGWVAEGDDPALARERAAAYPADAPRMVNG